MEVDGINEKRRELKCMINIIKSKKKRVCQEKCVNKL